MSKYGNRKTWVDGIRFDSIAEAKYYIVLRDRVRKKEISDLRLQVPYVLLPEIREEYIEHLKTKDKLKSRVVQEAVSYIADFVYTENGQEVVVDVKSEATAKDKVFILKKKMMRSLLGIEIQQVIC